MTARTIVFVHGMYMTPLCWAPWVERYSALGHPCSTPSWPGRDRPVAELRARHPDPQLGRLTLTAVVDHYADVLKGLDPKPVIIGHSMGGLIVQLLLQQGLAAAGVAIDSAPPMGVFTTQLSFLKANWPHITPFKPIGEPIDMSFERFQYAFVNGMPLQEQRAAYERYAVPESRRVPRESLTARIRFGQARAPLLLIAGSDDHIIPAALNRANYRKYRRSPSKTEFREFAGRTHFIIGQHNWSEVADYALAWLNQGAQPAHADE